jgi:hypothetical protein
MLLPIPPVTFWDHAILAGKVVGAAGVVVGFVYGGIRWSIQVVKKITSISTNIQHITDTTLPEVKQEVSHLTDSFTGFKSDVRDLSTQLMNYGDRLSENGRRVDAFSAAFLQHLADNGKEARLQAADAAAQLVLSNAKLAELALLRASAKAKERVGAAESVAVDALNSAAATAAAYHKARTAKDETIEMKDARLNLSKIVTGL